MILHQYYLCHHTPSSSGKRLMFLVSFTVALHCKSGFSFSFFLFPFLFFFSFVSRKVAHPNVQNRLRHLKKMKKKKKKRSVFVCFLHFLEMEGKLAFNELS